MKRAEITVDIRWQSLHSLPGAAIASDSGAGSKATVPMIDTPARRERKAIYFNNAAVRGIGAAAMKRELKRNARLFQDEAYGSRRAGIEGHVRAPFEEILSCCLANATGCSRDQNGFHGHT
jgi:hypothetical protein